MNLTVCVSDASSFCFTRRRTSRLTSSMRPGEPTCLLHLHLLSQRVMNGSDSPFCCSVLVLCRTKEALFCLTEVLFCELTPHFEFLHLKQIHCFYTFWLRSGYNFTSTTSSKPSQVHDLPVDWCYWDVQTGMGAGAGAVLRCNCVFVFQETLQRSRLLPWWKIPGHWWGKSREKHTWVTR